MVERLVGGVHLLAPARNGHGHLRVVPSVRSGSASRSGVTRRSGSYPHGRGAGPPRRGRCPPAVRVGRVPLDVRVLRPRTTPVRGRVVEAHPGGARGTAVSGHFHRVGRGPAPSHGGGPLGAPSDSRERG